MQLYQPSITGSLSVSGSINTTGTITATTLVVQTITSSTDYITGSTRFGSLPSNTHNFTGSLIVSGAVFISSSGNVGIGTTTPSGKLDVWGTIISNASSPSNTVGAGPAIYLSANSGSSYTYLQQGLDRFIYFGYTGGSWYERLTINNVTGNVGIGTSSPSGLLQLNGAIANSADAAAFTIKQSSTSYNNGIYIERSGERNGYHIYVGGAVDSLTFRRNYFGTQSDVMSLTRDGIVLINSTSVINTNTAMLQVISTGASGVAGALVVPNGASGGVCLNTQSVTSAGTGWYHIVCQSGNGSTITTNNMLVYGNGNVVNTNGSYGTLSDITLKENIVDVTPKLDNILQLKVRNFNLIADENKTKQIGFIAQEFEEVFPSMVEIDGGSGMKTIKTSVLVPMLVKAIQEQQAQINELKALLNK